jgi:hypothetical protein
MGVSRDTSGDALADMVNGLAAKARGPDPSPVTLSGADAQRLRSLLKTVDELLIRCGNTKEYRLKRDIQGTRAEIAAVRPKLQQPA